MLHIFYGRESIDKEKFIYNAIGENPGQTLVMVPDQYTLEAEKRAFSLLGATSLMDVEIVSMSRLGARLINQGGRGGKTFIDKYGRHMILAQIGSACESRLKVFKGSLRKGSFLEMVNNFISEMKQYNIEACDLAELRSGLNPDSLTAAKLSDLQILFSEYEKRISGKYTDSEDLIDLYMKEIEKSPLIRDSNIWIYGFDSFSPKAMNVLGHLMAAAKEVNVFLTLDRNCRDEELFALSEMVMKRLIREAEAFGVTWDQRRIAPGTGFDSFKKSQAIAHLERELYAVAGRPARLPELCGNDPSVILVKAANMYSEAESAASFILSLLRDKNFRCRDIVVICNDQNLRASVINRVFQEYGIPLFDDRKRNILSSPIAIFTVALLETAAYRYRTSDVFKALKTGFSPLSDAEIEILEDYAIKYRVKGTMWLRPFMKGQMEYGEDGLAKIEEIRKKAADLFEGVEALCRQKITTGDFICQYYDFLMEEGNLGEKISRLIAEQQERGFLDLAEETDQIWGCIVNLLDQITELYGAEPFDGKVLTELLTTGLSQMEVGVLPPTTDDILMGTVQRTRSGPVKATVVIGACEGLLPAEIQEEGIFSAEELDLFAAGGKEICKVDKVRLLEEQLAIYRNFAKPSQYLWVSYAASDEEGREVRPSELVDTLRRIFPELPERRDITESSRADVLSGGPISTLRYLTEELQRGRKGEKIDGGWKSVADWYRQHDPQGLRSVETGLAFTNVQPDLPKDLTALLYGKESKRPLALSPSRLERFSRCPFAHFIGYGLRPSERRIFEAAGREIGDIYHRCLMQLSRKLTEEDRWDSVTEEECRRLVWEIIREEAASYREGVFSFSNEEKYKTQRIADTCYYVCLALIEQVRAGKIKKSYFEVSFGRGWDIPAIEVNAAGEKILIEGKIDRMDVLADDRIKIIDYKTGKETFDVREAREGYRLQLMLYLKAAQSKGGKPAGVFYFLISDPRVDVTGNGREKFFEKISKEMRKFFRLRGIMVSDGQVIEEIAGSFEGYSDILPLRNTKDGVKATSEGFLLSEEEFAQLQADVDRQVSKLCAQLVAGRIAIRPKKTDRQSACTYCQYRGICRFDLEFAGCDYEVIR